jgi:precorrin-4/cobalt-precorrin-4 C11-methyltransferase
VSQTIILTRVADRTPVPEAQELAKLAATRSTLCIFLSVHKLAEICQTLSHYYGADCPAAVVFRASWPDQKILRGTLNDLAGQVAAEGISRTAMIVVGHALGRDIPVSKLYDAGFTHGYRKATV